ncbi:MULTISPECIES: hypothetical protein [unclassified Paenibacillus]|uniref:hypothetical protein n=1 Tax=unclassified Paenibacillus TaxID=185978 RepID=UPI0010428D0A|nr:MULTISPECIES: hypothetical protein [unclassified Paenibacillus]NIK69554.1 hypothetical protein [Paenibacillus sp. BK720]TCM95731.1 hypothetical protein EV294_10699 [Paenibacillus sp. BK033]
MSTKSLRIATLIIFLINVILIFLVDWFTVEMLPDKGISGDGNPAVILWFIELPMYLLLLAGVALIVHRERYLVQYNRIRVLLILLVFFAVSVLLQVDNAQRIHDRIDGRTNDYGWLNPYTNTIYINFYSFLSGILLLLLIQTAITLIRNRFYRGDRLDKK